MNTNNKKIIASVLLLILAIVLFLLFKKNPVDSSTSSQSDSMLPKATTNDSDSSIFSGSIFDLAKSGGNVMCSYETEDEKYKMTGKSYISGKKMRMISTTTLAGQPPVESHMISDGEWFYSWSNAMPQGMKMKISEIEKSTAPTTPGDQSAQVDKLKQDYDFECNKWNPDNSMFDLPANVEFMDVSQFMKPQSDQGTTPSACAACNYMQDADQKAECLASLNCN